MVIEPFLEPAEIAEWKSAVLEAVAERGSQRLPDSEHLLRDDEHDQEQRSYYEGIFTQRINLWQTNLRVRRLMLDARLGKFAAELANVEGIRIWHDQALFKPPYGNPTAFHVDVPFWSFSSTAAISIWVALDDATLENGCLYYVPGSQKVAKFDYNVELGPALGALFELYPEWKDTAPVACPVRPGGAIFHNGLVFHGAGANMSPRWRLAMTCAFMPDGSTFNGKKNILTDAQAARYSVGDVLCDDGQNPLLYSKTRSPSAGVKRLVGDPA